MDKIKILYIEGQGGRVTYGVERTAGDEEAYQKFLKERKLIDIDGKTCYTLSTPKESA